MGFSNDGMRDVSLKYNTLRTAKAAATLSVRNVTVEAIRAGHLPKADPLAIARAAGVQAAKQTSALIPYCHQVPLDFVGVEIRLGQESIEIETEVKSVWKTGVEMEALVAASTAALTLYDMLKIIDDSMEIRSVRLLEKHGGKSDSMLTGEGHAAAVIVLSDSVARGADADRSGRFVMEEMKRWKFPSIEYCVLPDEREGLIGTLKQFSDVKGVDLIITTGGTGMGPRDVTPEATAAVIERRLEGVEEALRSFGQERIATAMLSRSIAGVRGNTVIVNLPGSLRAVQESVSRLFPALFHAFHMLEGERHP